MPHVSWPILLQYFHDLRFSYVNQYPINLFFITAFHTRSPLAKLAKSLQQKSVNDRLTSTLRMSAVTIDTTEIGITVQTQRFRKATKQLATLGPASSSFEMIEKLFLSGADIFRLNFSHGEYAQKSDLVKIIRDIEKKYNHPIAILADLQVRNSCI